MWSYDFFDFNEMREKTTSVGKKKKKKNAVEQILLTNFYVNIPTVPTHVH